MTLFGVSAAALLAWLLALAFFGASVVNAAGSAAIKDEFVRWPIRAGGIWRRAGWRRWRPRSSRCRPRALRALRSARRSASRPSRPWFEIRTTAVSRPAPS